MDPSKVTCPLCQSDRVRQTGTADDIAIYACDACNAQFTVTIPRTRRTTTVARPAARSTSKKL